jgi:hypothetical protein
MADVSNGLLYEVLKQLPSDMFGVKDALRENTAALNALRTHMIAQAQDIHNIYAILSRLERIERHLDIVEVA